MSQENLRYAVWNNKGGVGKTFVTFVAATEYANLHLDKTVVVIDMCPQANVSEILLGGNGVGATNLEALLAQSPRRTIGGYFDERITQPHRPSGNESSFLTAVAAYNNSLPLNLYLVAGDPRWSCRLRLSTKSLHRHFLKIRGLMFIRGLLISLRPLVPSIRMLSFSSTVTQVSPLTPNWRCLQQIDC